MFIENVFPDIPDHCLEMDRAHRALQPPRQDGLPRDIVVKPNFYKVKKEVMRQAQETENLAIQGHTIQLKDRNYSDSITHKRVISFCYQKPIFLLPTV